MSSLGEPCKLRADVLPTKMDIYRYYLYLNIEKTKTGDWKQNTKFYEKVKCVRDGVAGVWDRTGIPHRLSGKEGLQKTTNLLVQCKKMTTVAMHNVREDYGKELACANIL